MKEVTKLEIANNWEGFYVSTDDGVFSISRIDDNFYFKPEAGFGKNDRYLNQKNIYNFRVDNDNIAVYSVFDELYNAVKNRMPYSNSKYDFKEKNYVLPDYADINDESKLFKDGKIMWHSDECEYDTGSVLIIEKEDNCYNVTFTKSMETKTTFPTFTVKVSIASPRYYSYSTTFMSMYQNLDDSYNNSKDHIRVRK